VRFDHARTGFALEGKHRTIPCGECHRETSRGAPVYSGLATRCESCHKDPHASQFARNGSTDCAPCHSPEAWTALAFDHNLHSAFRLTGAHQNVPCRSCHREESTAGMTFVRFKPLPTTCEACHEKRPGTDG
jgi:hypothetical protein